MVIKRERDISRRRDCQNVGVSDGQWSRLRVIRTSGEEFDRFSFPRGAINDCLSIGRKPGRPNRAAAKREPLKDPGVVRSFAGRETKSSADKERGRHYRNDGTNCDDGERPTTALKQRLRRD